MVICADTSFLFSLYGNDVHTPRTVAWMKSQRSALTITALGEYELGNALRVCNLADVVVEAKRLSATHTLTGGHRGFDILHVATALTVKAQQLLTFDGNQKKLAEAEGLVVPV